MGGRLLLPSGPAGGSHLCKRPPPPLPISLPSFSASPPSPSSRRLWRSCSQRTRPRSTAAPCSTSTPRWPRCCSRTTGRFGILCLCVNVLRGSFHVSPALFLSLSAPLPPPPPHASLPVYWMTPLLLPLRADLTQGERQGVLDDLMREVMSLWQTDELRRQKPTPLDGG